MSDDRAWVNTDRELWRERPGDFYADSIHVTTQGAIGINCGGYVYVKPVREWHKLAGGQEAFHTAAAALELVDEHSDIAYLRWRLKEIIPLFEEARDALCAIPLASAKLHNVDLSLGARMDAAGTRTRAEYDILTLPVPE